MSLDILLSISYTLFILAGVPLGALALAVLIENKWRKRK